MKNAKNDWLCIDPPPPPLHSFASSSAAASDVTLTDCCASSTDTLECTCASSSASSSKFCHASFSSLVLFSWLSVAPCLWHCAPKRQLWQSLTAQTSKSLTLTLIAELGKKASVYCICILIVLRTKFFGRPFVWYFSLQCIHRLWKRGEKEKKKRWEKEKKVARAGIEVTCSGSA